MVEGRQVVAAFAGGQVTSDAGALLLGAANRALGLVRRLAGGFTDGRAPELVEHTVETMLMQRICGIALGYEDLVDHDELRHDPVLAALAGKLAARRKDCAPLAGKVGAQVRRRGRRIKVAMASACPYPTEYHLAYLSLKRAAFCASGRPKPAPASGAHRRSSGNSPLAAPARRRPHPPPSPRQSRSKPPSRFRG